MKGIRLLILTALLLASCQTLPAINSILPQAGSKDSVCPSPFLKESYRLVHAVEVRMAGDTGGAIIGITVADPATRFVSCAIMTAEGMVLFEAEATPLLKVIRALPPFDSKNFAENMINDIKLIFFAPEGNIRTKEHFPTERIFAAGRRKAALGLTSLRGCRKASKLIDTRLTAVGSAGSN